jgi:hypothetical protein
MSATLAISNLGHLVILWKEFGVASLQRRGEQTDVASSFVTLLRFNF